MEYYFMFHKEEHIWICWTEVNEPRACYTEWSKSEKNEYHILTHVLESRKVVLMNLSEGKDGDARV